MSPIPTQVAIPQIKWGKRKERSQMCIMYTWDGRKKGIELDVQHGSMTIPGLSTKDGWMISPENQIFDKRDGTWKQLINEKSGIPICLFQPIEDAKERANEIFKNARIAAEQERIKDALQSIIWDKITWIVSVVFGSFIIIAAIQKWG